MCKSLSGLSVDSPGDKCAHDLEKSKTCSVVSCGGVAHSLGLCGKHYRADWRERRNSSEKQQTECRSCSGFFTPARAGQKYCGHTCAARLRRGCKAKDEVRSHVCTHCGEGYQSASVTTTLYCSKRCKAAAWKKANPEQHKVLRKRSAPLPHSKVFFNSCRVCDKEWTGKTSSLVCSYKCHAVEVFRSAAKEIACANCATVFCPTYEASRGRPSCRCQVCQEVVAQESKRVARASRKARQVAATVEKVDPYKVFARDKWHCQDCGTHTPRSKRGSYADDAPELDHIKPLSKGGEHSYKNTQCLCRRCNQEKSDTWQPQGEESLLQA